MKYISAFFSICLLFNLAASEQVKVERYLLPLQNDFESFFYTDVAIEFSSTNSAPVELSTFLENNKSAYANVFKMIMEGIDKNSADSIEKLTDPSIDRNNSLSQMVQWMNKNFKKLQQQGKLLMIKEIISKDQVTYFCGIKKQDKYILCALPIYQNGNGLFWYWSPNGNLSSYALICDMFRQNMLKDAPSNNYEYVCSGKTINSEVIKIKFNGKKCNISIHDNPNLDKSSYLHDIVNFYKRYNDAGETSITQCASFYTDKSKKKFLAWIERAPEYARDQFVRSKDKTITFVMDANPMYIVFYKGKSSQGSFQNWDYIIKTKAGLKFTNLSCYDSFHHFIKNNTAELQKVIYEIEKM